MPTGATLDGISSDCFDATFDASDAPTRKEVRMVVATLSRRSSTLATGMLLTDEDMQLERAKRIARVHRRVAWTR